MPFFLQSLMWYLKLWPRPLVLTLLHGNSFRHVLQEALPLGSFSKYYQKGLWCFVASMKSYRGMSTIQLQYIKFNFHFCPTCLKIVLCWEQSLQKSSESESSVMVVGKCEWTTYMPYGGGRNNTEYRCFEIIAQRFQQKHVNYNLVFFSRRDRDFYNLIVRDEIEICTFYISCFETRSRFVSSISHASRRDWEFSLSNLEFREGDEK